MQFPFAGQSKTLCRHWIRLCGSPPQASDLVYFLRSGLETAICPLRSSDWICEVTSLLWTHLDHALDKTVSTMCARNVRCSFRNLQSGPDLMLRKHLFASDNNDTTYPTTALQCCENCSPGNMRHNHIYNRWTMAANWFSSASVDAVCTKK